MAYHKKEVMIMMSGSAPDARAVSMFGIAQVIGIAGAALSVTLIVLLIRALLKYLRSDGRRSPPEQSRNLGEAIKTAAPPRATPRSTWRRHWE